MNWISFACLAGAAFLSASALPNPSPASITTVPSITLAARADVTPVSECGPISLGGGNSACLCFGYDGLLPTTTSSFSPLDVSFTVSGFSVDSTMTELCPMTAVTGTPTLSPTSQLGATDGYPFPLTMPNKGVVAYQTVAWTNGELSYGGANTTIRVGTSVAIGINSVNAGQTIGTVTGDALYTAISQKLEAACPTVTAGETISGCNSVASITDVPYIAPGPPLMEKGELTFEVSLVSYSDAVIRASLITSVAAAFRAASVQPENTKNFTYYTYYNPDTLIGDTLGWIDITHIPQAIQAIMVDQTEETDGSANQSWLELTTLFDADSDFDMVCTQGAMALAALGVLALFPPLSFLTAAVAASTFAFSLACELAPISD